MSSSNMVTWVFEITTVDGKSTVKIKSPTYSEAILSLTKEYPEAIAWTLKASTSGI